MDPDRICGVNAVRALFLRRPEAVLRLFHTAERRRDAGPLCAHLARTRRPYREVDAAELTRIAGTQHHGGLCAVAAARRAEPWLGNALPPALAGAFLLVLDGIGNPHNLGAIARSAAFFGARALLLSDDPRQCDLSDAAFRVAEGGLEHLAVARVSDLPAALRHLAGTHRALGAVPAGGVPPHEVPRDRPIALVLGAEEAGLPAATLHACAGRVTLAGAPAMQSLNVAAAAAVLLHALAPAPSPAPRRARM